MPRVDLRITDKLAWLISKPKRIKIAVGGRGSAKSTGFADIMLMFADQGERICCAREFQNSIDESVHELLKQEIDRLGIEGFVPTKTEIVSGSGGKLFYKGLARNITSLKSLAGVKRLWVEEGEATSESSLKILTPSIRSAAGEEDEDPPEIWISMNRGSTTDAVAKKYLSRAEESLKRTGYYEDDLMMVVEMNWRDNPWFPVELEQERQDDFDKLTRAEYDHIWEGGYNDSVENALIYAEWFDACIDAHKTLGFEPLGAKIASHDPSDVGKDTKGYAMRHGAVVVDIQEKESGDVNEGADWACGLGNEQGVDFFTWDGDGMGCALTEKVSQAFNGKVTRIHMFKGSESPDHPDSIYMPSMKASVSDQKTNKQAFRNKRAQYYADLRDRVYRTYRAVAHNEFQDPDTLISFSSDIELLPKLRAELCKMPIKPNKSGLLELYTKDELRTKFKYASPNLADSLMMNMRFIHPNNREFVLPRPIKAMGIR